MLSQKSYVRSSLKIVLAVVVLALGVVGNLSFAVQAAPAPSKIIHAQTSIPDNLIKRVGFGPNGEWLILYGTNGYSSDGLAAPVLTNLAKINDANEEIQWMAFGPAGAYLLSSAKSFYSDKLPTDMDAEINRLIAAGNGNDIKFAAFAPTPGTGSATSDPTASGWVIIWGKNGYTEVGLPKSATDEIDKLNTDNKEIKQLTFDSNGEWLIVYGDNGLIWSTGVVQPLVDQLKKLNDAGEVIRQVEFAPDTGAGIGWVVLYGTDKVVGQNLPSGFVDEMKKLDPTLQ